MKYPQIALSPSKSFLYVWTKEKFIFVRGGRCVDFAIDEARRYYKRHVNPHATELDLLALPLGLRSLRHDVVEILVKGLRENLSENDLFYSRADYRNDPQDKQVLIDIIHCIGENSMEREIVFDEIANGQRGLISEYRLDKTLFSEFSGKKVHRRRGRLEKSLPCQYIASYVAGSEGITFRLADDSFEFFGSKDFSYDYEFHLNKHS
jgi:hypothetical protein